MQPYSVKHLSIKQGIAVSFVSILNNRASSLSIMCRARQLPFSWSICANACLCKRQGRARQRLSLVILPLPCLQHHKLTSAGLPCTCQPRTTNSQNPAYSFPLQLVGPLLGPLLGGVLSQVWGWRSTFICLVVFCGGVVAPLLAVLVPETHQYRVVRSLSRTDPAAAKMIAGEAHCSMVGMLSA